MHFWRTSIFIFCIQFFKGSSSSVYRWCWPRLHMVSKHLWSWPQRLSTGISAWGWHISSPCAKGSRLLYPSWQDALVLFKSSHNSGAFSWLFPTKYPAPLTAPETISKAKQLLELSFFDLFCYKPTKRLIRGMPSVSPLSLPSPSEG